MSTYTVTLTRDGKTLKALQVGNDGVLIGRAEGADFQVPDHFISRQHARLRVCGEQLIIEDLHSLNGIVVNGRLTQSSSLTESDVVTMGPYQLLVERCDDGERMLSGQTARISPDEASGLRERMVASQQMNPLTMLYECAEALLAPGPAERLCGAVLERLVAALPARRGFALTRQPEDKRASLAAQVPAGDSSEGPPLSNTLIRHVLKTRNAVLTTNAQEDPRFEGGCSIFQHGIEAAICVPLHGRTHCFGVLYLDAGPSLPPDPDAACPFTLEHLQLAAVAGQMLGVALENGYLQTKQVERERLAALGESVANVSHCMKNVLTGISGGAEVLETALARDDAARASRGMTLLRDSVSRFRDLVCNMLDFTKHAGAPELRPVLLQDLVREVVDVLRPHAEKHGVALEAKERALAPVLLDRDQMYRALLNLVTNAVEACEGRSGARVTISAWQTKEHTRISVRDTGKGIPESELPKLLQAFFTTKGSGNSGLGLPLCHRVVKAHGGELLVSSKEGAGAKFSILLPRTAQEGETVGRG